MREETVQQNPNFYPTNQSDPGQQKCQYCNSSLHPITLLSGLMLLQSFNNNRFLLVAFHNTSIFETSSIWKHASLQFPTN